MRAPERDLAGEASRLDRSAKLVIAICSLAYLLDGLVHTVLGPLAPTIAKSLALSNAALGPIFSANLIGQCVGLILFPLAAGRFGHRRIVVVTLIGFGLFQLLSAMAASGQQLFLFRLATGLFLGGALPSCLAMVTAVTPPARRGLIITALFFGYGLGCAMAGLANLLPFGGWRGSMGGIGGLCLLSAFVACRWLREPVAPEVHANPRGAPNVARDALELLAPATLVGTLMLWVLFISMLTISYCLNSWLPTLLVQVGRDPSLASISISIFGLGGIVAALGVGLLIDRFGPTRVLVTSMLVSTALLFWIGQVLATASTAVLLSLLGACGFFALGSYAGINVVLANFYPHHLRALGIGMTKSIGRIGTVVAPILIGFGLNAGMEEGTVMSLFAAPTALSALALLVIAATRRASERRMTGAMAPPVPAE